MLNFGIIGCGNIASVHAETLNQMPDAKLRACCDIETSVGENFAARYQCQFYQYYADLLIDERIDAVVIATPHFLHHEMSLAALAANKHVLCEKPMAIKLEDAREINAAVQKSKQIYHVCYQNRFNLAFVKLKKMLNENSFGSLHGVNCSLTWHRDNNYYSANTWRGKWATEGGGVLINQAIHSLDAICWLIGKPQRIKGTILSSLLSELIEVEDAAIATAVLENGPPIVISASNNYSTNPSPAIDFDFEGAAIRLTNESLIINEQEIVLDEPKATIAGKSYWGQGHPRLIRTFVNEITGQTDELIPYLPRLDAIDSLALVCGIYQSHQTNQWVELV
ncbi:MULTISPECIES: Gfo/Idh/MocA family oxidoreductase [unclassified Enterococcus]|uniref:Gfo/Idh/MocA family protein n=1 Tax=unclassified Enterococcus TaxID=2608891 RepID=UPI0015541BF4|nr:MULTISPECIES: Gfo/Idh/MocA family oxidoreductase [unclassified Enterococcus]MBS7578153.1 Gfo/Idh/MocA family oxidoreductase [Enterococcus sp. MMGLQ5-2]MBS7584031.1 Gfo/Idh/MocA family oxidoreductase [Enterococcus sp. MMGLQ5-1]NPD11892.1 Gfo/Idh/MocA family oxidoreductase [Enterococcus sp. MMGLQ5-1]NPD37984.1 Gfo/Idh/MocA family oxidoreductase [Enterococcus sp. MMGLQ5-2]